MKKLFFIFAQGALLFLAAFAEAAEEEEWVTLGAGGRPAYMGIQGGTMPISLLVADNGAALLTFVGRTGNDFLETLKATDIPLPRLLNATRTKSAQLALPPANGLVAGNATASLPVITLAGERIAAQQAALQPFGLSDEPLQIEGEIMKPKGTIPKIKNCRISIRPAFLQPRR